MNWSYKISDIRRLPIVGDVHLQREEWPSSPEDWQNLLSIQPGPVQLNKIFYSVNQIEKAFEALSLNFRGQKFRAYSLSATSGKPNMSCLNIPSKMKPAVVKIKQRNNVEGVSKICGLKMLTSKDEMIVSIDLCPGLGQWRSQHLDASEFIIGLHTYVLADDESVDQIASN